MATVDAYTDRLRRAAIACLSTSLRHGSPVTLDALCELERAVYTEPDVSPEPARRAAVDTEAVDTEAVMAEVSVYGNHCRNQFDAMVKGYGDEEQRYNDLAGASITAIRAMLEPSDVAIEASGRVTVDRAPATLTFEEAQTLREWFDDPSELVEKLNQHGLMIVRISDLERLP